MRIELTQQSGLGKSTLCGRYDPRYSCSVLSGTIHLRSFWEMLRRYYPPAICGIR